MTAQPQNADAIPCTGVIVARMDRPEFEVEMPRKSFALAAGQCP
jgi:Ni,Fe-hydrogenase III small subunit